MIFKRLQTKEIIDISKCFIRYFYQELSAAELPKAHVPIRNVKYLPGSSSQKLPEFISTRDHPSLKVIRVNSQAENTKQKAAEFLEENINQYAAILVKGFNIENDKDLKSVTKYLSLKYMTYNSGSGFRDEVSSNIYTASEEPHDYTIELHNEMSVLPYSPSKILFCCVEAADTGGESPISFNRDALRDLDPKIYESLKGRKIKYMRTLRDEKYTDYLTWQYTFETTDRKKAEDDMRKQGIQWEWLENDDLCIYNFCEAIRHHPVTNEIVWFNQATANHCTYYSSHPMFEGKSLSPTQYPYHCQYGDGEEIEDETVEHLREIYWKNAIPLKLEKGDILFMDNFLCQHSRMAFNGKRKILVNLFA